MDFLTFTMVYEWRAAGGWTGYVRELPLLGRVQAALLAEVRHQLAAQLVDIVWQLPNLEDIRITSEFYYRFPQ